MKVVPKHRRLLVCGSRVWKVFEYQRPFQPDVTDDSPICNAIFSEKRLEIYVAGDRSIKIWDARTGMPIRVIKNVFQTEITQMAIDEHHRKLVVGSHQGELKVFDIQSGFLYHQLDGHDYQDGEISYIGYGGEDHTIISMGWDRTIMVHLDQYSETKKDTVRRGKENCHRKEIICGDYAHYLGLIATGSRDNQVKIWDYERINNYETITAHHNEIQIVQFLKPFQLLLTSDSAGHIFIWCTKKDPKSNHLQCMAALRH